MDVAGGLGALCSRDKPLESSVARLENTRLRMKIWRDRGGDQGGDIGTSTRKWNRSKEVKSERRWLGEMVCALPR